MTAVWPGNAPPHNAGRTRLPLSPSHPSVPREHSAAPQGPLSRSTGPSGLPATTATHHPEQMGAHVPTAEPLRFLCSAWLSEMEPPRGEVGPGQGEGAGHQVGPGQRQNSLWVFQMRNGTGISGPCVAALCVGWQESQVAGGTPGTSLSPQRLHAGKSLAKTPAALSRGRGAVKATYDSPLPLVWRHLSQLLCGHIP